MQKFKWGSICSLYSWSCSCFDSFCIVSPLRYAQVCYIKEKNWVIMHLQNYLSRTSVWVDLSSSMYWRSSVPKAHLVIKIAVWKLFTIFRDHYQQIRASSLFYIHIWFCGNRGIGKKFDCQFGQAGANGNIFGYYLSLETHSHYFVIAEFIAFYFARIYRYIHLLLIISK